MNDPPRITVIVPFCNAASTLGACLEAIRSASPPFDEVIAVDDGSVDNCVEICAQKQVRVLRMETRSGPAAARNRGARAADGDLLCFLDADVVTEPDNAEKIARCFQADSELAAVFGSYDTSPGDPRFVSQYRNLLHHVVHQHANVEARTFWAGCGAVRRDVFLEIGGFDAQRYPEPSVEDIEFGLRLHRRGHRIRLEKSLQVKHLKSWRLFPMLRTDIRCRAWPWSLLILERGDEVSDLNVDQAGRWSGALVCLAVALIFLSLLPHGPPPALTVFGALAALVCAVGLNLKIYRFFARERGLLFAAGVIPLHLLYFLTGSLTFGTAWIWVRLLRRRPPREEPSGTSAC